MSSKHFLPSSDAQVVFLLPLDMLMVFEKVRIYSSWVTFVQFRYKLILLPKGVKTVLLPSEIYFCVSRNTVP